MVALGVDQVKLGIHSLDLSTQNKGCLGVEAGLDPILFVFALLPDTQFTNIISHFRQIAGLSQIEFGILFEIPLNLGHHCLTGGQITC